MRIVAKIGTASITTDDGVIDHDAIARLVDETAALRTAGHEVIIVSSGAVAAGVAALGMDQRPGDMQTVQAVSAVGQSRLVEAYNDEFARHGVVGAQLLVDPFDFVERRQYLHLRSTTQRLLELGVVPVVNENDAIANDELRYGDNDRIAALIANSVGADVLVLLTDMDGVFTADPRRDSSATLIPLREGRRSVVVDLGRRRRQRAGEWRDGEQADRCAHGVVVGDPQCDRPGVTAWACSPGRHRTSWSERRSPRTSARSRRASCGSRSPPRWPGRSTSMPVPNGPSPSARTACSPPAWCGPTARSSPGRWSTSPDPTTRCSPAGSRRPAPTALSQVLGHHTSALPDGMANTVVHRDDLVILA